MFNRTPLITVVGAALALTLSGSANADEYVAPKHRFGAPGIIFSADRFLPLLTYTAIKVTQGDGSSETQSRFSVALMNNGPYGVFSSFYNLPRLGMDWVPIQNLTLGGALWLYMDLQATDSVTPAGGSSKSTDQPKLTYWGVAPRVGYVFPLSEKLYIWPRAGVEYHNVTSSGGGAGPTITEFAFEAEALLVISPWEHFGFQVGPTADIPISGSQTISTTTTSGMTTTTTSNKVDSSMLQVGVSAGMLGHF